jgi:hypothetical protein
MKTMFSKFLVMVLTIAFISMSLTSPTGAQSPQPPEILDNGELPLKLDEIEQALTERSQTDVNGGGNAINATSTWFSSSGTTFVPSSSSISYNYGGDGCVDTGANVDVWRGSVNIPHGSTIEGMWFNYDNEVVDPVDSTIYVRRYSYSGAYQDILSITGTYTGIGNQSQLSYIAENNIVDNLNYAYVLVWVGQMQQNLCSVNLRYSPPPVFLSALPFITH